MSAVMTGGVAVADIDNDGDEDLYIITGNQFNNALMRNNGDGTFTNISLAAGVGFIGEINSGPVFGDLNGDGLTDLIIGGYAGSGVNILLNNGDNSFTEIPNTGIANRHNRNDFSSTLGDPDRDGDLDIFISHWGPNAGANHLWINDGNGYFSAANQAWAISSYISQDFTFTANFNDINNDGWPDLLVTGDFDTSEIFINTGNGNFINTTTSIIDDENGMGATVADFDNDGDLDWFISSISQNPPFIAGNAKTSGNRLFINNGHGIFSDATTASGLREGYWGWGSCAADFNNDGWLDLVHTNGFPGSNSANDFFNDPVRLFINNQDGSFTENSAGLGITDTQQGRGISCLDYDNDGDVDILIMNHNGTVVLYRNNLNSGNYLQVLVETGDANQTVAGTRIMLENNGVTQMREISFGSNFQSQNPTTQHFGLADSGRVEKLTIIWPDGSRNQFDNFAINRQVTISQSNLANQGIAIPINNPSMLVLTLILLFGFGLRAIISQKNM